MKALKRKGEIEVGKHGSKGAGGGGGKEGGGERLERKEGSVRRREREKLKSFEGKGNNNRQWSIHIPEAAM